GVRDLGRRSGRPRMGDDLWAGRTEGRQEGGWRTTRGGWTSGSPSRPRAPGVVAATRLFLVAGVALVLVDEAGGLQAAVAAGDLAQALEEVAPQLWSGPAVEAPASGAAVRTTDLPGEARWSALANRPELAGVNSLLCVPVEGAAGPAGTLTAVRRPDRPWQAQEVEALLTYAGVVASLVGAAAGSERTTQIIDQLEPPPHHRRRVEP